METGKAIKEDVKAVQKNLTAWWTENIETSWLAAKQGLVADWQKLATNEKALAHEAAEEAIAFGHGARDAFKDLQTWSVELQAKLESDWKDGHRTAHAWEQVKDAVRHGWNRATDAVKTTADAVKTTADAVKTPPKP